ncbi:MAG: glycosyl hydrolase family 95 catalytic domain-containing protein [Planctomycetota bacterium]|jgi:hypothetical protein
MENTETLIFNFPLERTHCGMVMGNGNFGAMIWGKDRLHITVNRSDFWEHRGGEVIVAEKFYQTCLEISAKPNCKEELIEAHNNLHVVTPDHINKPSRIPVGRFELVFKDGVVPVTAELEYSSGTVTVTLSDNKKLTLDMSISQHCLFINDTDNVVQDVECKSFWEFEKSRNQYEPLAFTEPEKIAEENLNGWLISCPADDDPSLAALCEKSNDGYAIILDRTGKNAESVAAAKEILVTLNKDALLAESRAWWQQYWKTAPEVNIPDQFFNKIYKYFTYKFAAATHPNGYACSLQGPFTEEYQEAQWCGDYHFNVNIQQIYTAAFALGKFDHVLPLFDMIETEEFQKSLLTNGKSMFGVDDCLWFTHAVDDKGFQVGGLGPGAILDPASGAWVAQLYWFYYKYSGDKDFLKERAMPFMRGIMRGYEEMLDEHNGRLSIPLAISAEYSSSNPNVSYAGRDSSNQLSAAHMLLNYLFEACEILGEEPKELWLRMKKELPHFTVIDGRDLRYNPEKHIAIWEGQDLDVCHRHHSHLALIYPFDSLPEKISEEDEEIIHNSIDHWIGRGMGLWSEWCMPWAAIIQSRMGFQDTPFTLLTLWKDTFINEGLTTAYLPRSQGLICHRRHDMLKPKETNEVMQLDGTMGYVAAVNEFCAQSRRGIIYLFQGIPQKWQDVSFKDIYLPDGFKISGEKKNGIVINVKITATRKGTIKLGDSGVGNMKTKNGEKVSFPVSFDFEAGDVIELSRD